MRYIYKITNLLSGKVYIGQTNDVNKRKYTHFYNARNNDQRYLYRAIRKYGKQNFIIETIEQCEDELSNDREQYWIEYYDSTNHDKGYNLTLGGYHFQFSEETIKKMSDSHKGKKLSEEQKQKISNATKGENHPMWNKFHSEESKQKMSDSHKDKIPHNKNIPMSAEQKQKLSDITKNYLSNVNNRIKRSKLTIEDINTIHDMLNKNIPLEEISKIFNVCKFTIQKILNNTHSLWSKIKPYTS